MALEGHDGGMTAESDRIGPMTDEEAELFRWLRFGQLPERVRPEDRVELVETEPRPEVSVVRVGATGAWYVSS